VGPCACLLQALSWGIHIGCDESIRLSPYRALYDIPARAIDRSKLEGSVNLMGESGRGFSAEQGARVPAERASQTDLAADPSLPAETRLWATVQEVSGGLWGGCAVDVGSILKVLAAGSRAIEDSNLC
jgi:xylonate dehydratase